MPGGKPRWRRRPEARPAEIAGAGLRLFCERGYRGVTVDDIARAAGVTKGAVYHHFGGKDDVLVAAVELYFRRAFDRGRADAGPTDSTSAAERMRAVLWSGWRFWHTDEFQGLFRLALGEGGAAVPKIRKRFLSEGPHRGWKVLGEIIATGQASGEFRSQLDPHRSAQLITSGLVLPVILDSFARSGRRASRADFDRAFELVMKMLRP